MILFEICDRSEAHPLYQQFEAANGARQYDFLRTLVEASLAIGRPFLSGHVIKALNFQAITCLHTNAGEYRPCQVRVGSHNPIDHYLVQSHMDDFINTVNRSWESTDPLVLGAYVLWRLNYIHPFINGNGRTARAASYFVICLKLGGWLVGTVILPELLRRNRDEYIQILQQTDLTYHAGALDVAPLVALLQRLLSEQIASAAPPPAPAADDGQTPDPGAINAVPALPAPDVPSAGQPEPQP
jgi:prophage maintenance system killer protein